MHVCMCTCSAEEDENEFCHESVHVSDHEGVGGEGGQLGLQPRGQRETEGKDLRGDVQGMGSEGLEFKGSRVQGFKG